MPALILEVKSYKKISVNGILYDEYKLKLKEGNNIYITTGLRRTFLLELKQGYIIENMRAIGELSSEEFAEEWRRAKEIEGKHKIGRSIQDITPRYVAVTKSNAKKVKKKDSLEKKSIGFAEQLSLFN